LEENQSHNTFVVSTEGWEEPDDDHKRLGQASKNWWEIKPLLENIIQ